MNDNQPCTAASIYDRSTAGLVPRFQCEAALKNIIDSLSEITEVLYPKQCRGVVEFLNKYARQCEQFLEVEFFFDHLRIAIGARLEDFPLFEQAQLISFIASADLEKIRCFADSINAKLGGVKMAVPTELFRPGESTLYFDVGIPPVEFLQVFNKAFQNDRLLEQMNAEFEDIVKISGVGFTYRVGELHLKTYALYLNSTVDEGVCWDLGGNIFERKVYARKFEFVEQQDSPFSDRMVFVRDQIGKYLGGCSVRQNLKWRDDKIHALTFSLGIIDKLVASRILA